MSSFRFNFNNDDNEPYETCSKTDSKEDIEWLESEEIVPDKQIKSIEDVVKHAKMFTCGDVEIGHVIAKEAIISFADSCLKSSTELAEYQHSDLITGKYEGGLKIWECTNDLLEYLIEKREVILENAKVLDLGCGAGILGIYALLQGSEVTFQDYNREILECITIPNVLLNTEEETRESDIKKCKFYSGDWDSFNKKFNSEIYDMILTSETIYNPCNYDKLIELFMQKLSANGVVYLAAKTYYFGVGGGTRQFEKSIDNCGLLKSEICWKSEGGIQREILKITRKNDLF